MEGHPFVYDSTDLMMLSKKVRVYRLFKKKSKREKTMNGVLLLSFEFDYIYASVVYGMSYAYIL